MKKEMKDYLRNCILTAKRNIQGVWAKTEDWTPESALCEAICHNMVALLRLLELVKEED